MLPVFVMCGQSCPAFVRIEEHPAIVGLDRLLITLLHFLQVSLDPDLDPDKKALQSNTHT